MTTLCGRSLRGDRNDDDENYNDDNPQIDFVYLADRLRVIPADQPSPTASITILILLEVWKKK